MRTPLTPTFYLLFLIMKEKNLWFKVKPYPHIGLPITQKDCNKVINYITNPENIKNHAFCPFIHTQIITPKFRKGYDGDGNLLHNGKRIHQKKKVRNIYYANHWDANIFAYYSHLLSQNYECVLKQKGLTEVVTAYRKIPKNNSNQTGKDIGKCNIDFANDVFEYIREYTQKHQEIAVIAFDIEQFFDNLDHKILKKAWENIIKKTNLPDDHYNVYKAITKFSYVKANDLFQLFQNEIIVKSKSGNIRKKPIKKLEYLRNQNAIAFCELKDIQKIRKSGLIQNNKYEKCTITNQKKLKNYGICQGSSISATLANIYMLEFDELIHHKIQEIGGIYRRYSDDMVVICPIDHKDEVLGLFETKIKSISKLNINPKKTQIFYFKLNGNNEITCLQEFNGKINHNSHKKKFEYLGFSFNGQHVYLKNSALANYYRKMSMGVRRCHFYANHIRNDTQGKIFKNRLYRQYSYIGAKPARVGKTKNKWKPSKRKNWGNFIGYAMRADQILTNSRIKYQLKNHWKILNARINK